MFKARPDYLGLKHALLVVAVESFQCLIWHFRRTEILNVVGRPMSSLKYTKIDLEWSKFCLK